jgi:iron complex outermembrane receptor protein
MYAKLATMCVWILGLVLCTGSSLYAQGNQKENDRVYDLGTVQVLERGTAKKVIFQPKSDIILVDEYEQPVIPQNIVDVIKDLPIIDFRGATDLVPDDDTIYMRGFSSKRFVTSIDGLTVRKSGGRRSSHIVDYSLIPAWMIEEIEILPGPHSALYPSKAIGGVLNLKTRTPKRYPTSQPEGKAQASYRSYNTQNHHINAHGGYEGLIYDLGGQTYSTDGYLQNNEADINTVHGRGGYVFDQGGYLTLSGTYTDADRQVPTINDPNDPQSNYDSEYPVIDSDVSGYYKSQDPTWDKIAKSMALNSKYPSAFGDISLDASYSYENRDLASYKLDGSDQSWETEWWQWSAKLMDEIQFADTHTSILGLEFAQLYDGYGRVVGGHDGYYNDHERFRNWGLFAEHSWRILPRLELTAGLRYEYLKAYVDNYDRDGKVYITGRDAWIERDWDQLIPKSFLTYELDDLASWLRDTSISVGVSRIWRAPGYHGDVNPQGRPAGAWLDPEEGMGYDLVFQRRLWGDMQIKAAFSYYEIEDFIATNSKFSQYDPRFNDNVPAGEEYKDYKLNLDQVQRKGLELGIRGHLFDPLFIYLGYAYLDFENKGDAPAGEIEVSNRAKHRVNAGLEYDLFDMTKILLDYKYQDSQIASIYNYLGDEQWSYAEVPIDSYHVVDLAVQQTLFSSWKGLDKGKLTVYANNLFNEEYENVDGYPATDQTFGVALSVSF